MEVWKPRPAWIALPQAEREAYLEGLGPAIQAIQAIGVELIGFACQDADVAHAADCTWVSVWRMPTRALAKRFEQAVIDTGFHDLFEQVNVRGRIVAADVVLREMAKA